MGRTVDAIERWYASLGQRVIVTVSAADPGADDLDRYLVERGYSYEAPVHVMVRDVGQRDRGEGTTAGADLDDDGGLTLAVVVGLDEEWAQRYAVAHGGDRSARQRTESYGRMLTVLGSEALGASAVLDGEVAGVGFGVVDRGHVGIFGMGTAARFRRRGVASAVVEALLATAAERGATRAYLQVETDNAAAIDLYQRLGFTRSHDYHYRVSAPPT